MGMRYGKVGEELWKNNIRRLERFNKEMQEEIKNKANTLVGNTSLTEDAALKMQLDFYEAK